MIDINLLEDFEEKAFTGKSHEFKAEVIKLWAEKELNEYENSSSDNLLKVRAVLNESRKSITKDLLAIDLESGVFIFKEKLKDMISVISFKDVMKISKYKNNNSIEHKEEALECMSN